MASCVDDLESTALDVHEIWIFHTFFAYTWTAITLKWHWYLLTTIDRRFKIIMGLKHMMLPEMKLFKCGQLLCGQSVIFLPMLCYLVGVQKESLLALVVTMTLILAILNIVGKCAIWIIMFFYRWIIHGDQTKDHSMEKLNLGLLQLL